MGSHLLYKAEFIGVSHNDGYAFTKVEIETHVGTNTLKQLSSMTTFITPNNYFSILVHSNIRRWMLMVVSLYFNEYHDTADIKLTC